MNGIENGLTKDDHTSKSNDDDDDSDLDDDDDEDYDEYDKTLLENYSSCIDSNDEVDEFVIFRDTLQSNLKFLIYNSNYNHNLHLIYLIRFTNK
jgi:hypothetical protein